jgi:aminoglycoside phosphotransferase (APT) family kinase protein
MPPCADEAEFNSRLIKPADPSTPGFEESMARVEKLHAQEHEVVFSHGDLAFHNIFIESDGRVAGLIDWEAAGFYPAYWESTTAWGVGTEGWWFDLVHELAEGKYHEEREADAGRWTVTNGTMFW